MSSSQPLRALVGLVLIACAAMTPAQVSPGHRLYGPLMGTDTYLIDVNGTIIHTWPSTFLPGVGVYLLPDGTLLRTIKTPNAPTIGGSGGGVQRLALDGTVLWDFRYDGTAHWSHHDVEPMPNGNVLMGAWDYKTVAEALAAGRHPSLISGNVMRPDSVIEVQPTGPTTGNIVWEWHLWDHLMQEIDPLLPNFGVISDHPELMNINSPPIAAQMSDFNHMNSVKYDPVFDRIMVSAHSQNEIWVIDHSTTTAEAASHSGGMWGHGGDILYRYGNPDAYDRGTPADKVFFGQHSARFIPPGYPGAGNFTVFNNSPPAGSTVWEYTPPMDAVGNFVIAPGLAFGPAAPVWTYSAAGFNSSFISSAERLQNGNTLICSGGQGWIFEINPANQTVFSYMTGGPQVFHAHYVDRKLWASTETISGTVGGTVTFDVIAGTQFASKTYVLLASASGTSPGIVLGPGLVLPLNFDPVLQLTFDNANTPLLTNTIGTLDANGRATATLNLPPGAVLGPVTGHFACAILDLPTATVVGVSNAVPLTIAP